MYLNALIYGVAWFTLYLEYKRASCTIQISIWLPNHNIYWLFSWVIDRCLRSRFTRWCTSNIWSM